MDSAQPPAVGWEGEAEVSEPIGRLIVYLGEQEVTAVSLTTQVLKLGRSPDNGLPLPNAQVSRYHAEVAPGPQGLMLTDLGSANGTFVGGERLLPNQSHLIAPGTSFQIGPFVLVFEAAAAPPAEEGDPEPPAQEPAPPTGEPAEEEQPEPAPIVVPVSPVMDQLARWEMLLAGQPSIPHPLPRTEQPSRYQASLPMIFHENDLLRRYLLIFESIWEPLEHRQDHLELYFDPRTCPHSFISWLASWFDLTVNQHWPEGRRRMVLAEIFELYRWRGTRHGLARMIELCTGLSADIDDRETPFVFRIRVSIPPGYTFDQALLEQLIEAHKPAHAGYILELVTLRSH
jgi:phage tail-like protein